MHGASAARTTIAVIGSSTALGGAVADRLVADDVRLLAVDAGPVGFVAPSAEVRHVDARDRLLALTLEDVDVVVHAAFTSDLRSSPDVSFGVNVGGTRNVLQACAKAGVSHLVVLSSTMVYGAHHDNAVPLDEQATLRANPMVAGAHHMLLAEREVADFAAAHPHVTVAVLRVGPVLGAAAEGFVPAQLNAPRLVLPTGAQCLWQFAHPDDVAEAVALILQRDARGTYNVACDGWMTTEEVARIRGRQHLEVGQTVVQTTLRLARDRGLAPAPPEVLPFLLHPLVVDVQALRALGWRPSRTNREVLSEFSESMGDRIDIGTLRLSGTALRQGTLSGAAILVLGALSLRRRRRRRRRAGAGRRSAGALIAAPPAAVAGT